MTQEDIKQVIKDHLELWVAFEENPKEKKEKEKDKGNEQENEPAKDKEEAKKMIKEKQQSARSDQAQHTQEICPRRREEVPSPHIKWC